jgi:hypothetical protein
MAQNIVFAPVRASCEPFAYRLMGSQRDPGRWIEAVGELKVLR